MVTALRLLFTIGLLASVAFVNQNNIWSLFEQATLEGVAILMSLLAVNLLLISIRLQAILRYYDIVIAFPSALKASIIGQAAGLFLIQIVGNFLGRASCLARHGVPAGVVANLTIFEKVISLLPALAYAVAGAWYLYGPAAAGLIAARLNGLHLFQTAAIGLPAFVAALILGGMRCERRLWRTLVTGQSLLILTVVTVLTLAAQASIIGAYLVLANGLPSPPPLAAGVAATSIIMFAASLPISVNGWGVREFASVHILGDLGIPADQALFVSISLGVSALLLILAATAVCVLADRTSRLGAPATPIRRAAELGVPQAERVSILLLGGLAAVAIFFQTQVRVGDTLISVNLADPFALLGGASFLFFCYANKVLPAWRVRIFNPFLAAATIALAGAFLIGHHHYGMITWALSNRMMGWLVLLGFLFTGALLTVRLGRNGTRRLLEGVGAAGCCFSLYLIMANLFQVGHFPLAGLFASTVHEAVPNRNTLAFQLLLALIAVLIRQGMVHPRPRLIGDAWGAALIPAMIATGVILTQSRAGMVSLVVVALTAAATRTIATRTLSRVGVLTAGYFLTLVLVGLATGWLSGGDHGASPILIEIDRSSSDTERWVSISGGIALWSAHPIFGAGLGAFIHQQTLTTGIPLVIHNSAVWLLAELGIVGFGIFAAAGAGLIAWSVANLRGPSPPFAARGCLLLLVCFGLFSQAHEVMYQRLFWLLLGALIACRPALRHTQAIAASGTAAGNPLEPAEAKGPVADIAG